ncbi:MAG TPA: sigma-70 family RNA polymerase sigma factor [Planctomycetota bacterium]|nr:sigma-70 family RNA polymerase sigma factor [Planctomycetota bacterium]
MDPFSFEHLDASDWAGEVAWLRALAASLVRDPDEAADLASDVWVQALQRRPDVGESRPLRAWLTVVSRRLAARRRREGGARREREQSAARHEGLPSADRAIERVELQRKLVEAVLSLDEPYRSAVVLRHLEQLSPAEIAQRQGCTSEAARQRIARGLAQLRARLDRDFDGGRAAWHAVLAPFAGQAAPAGGAALAGAAAVSSKAAGGALAIVGVLLLCWWWPDFRFQASSASGLDPEAIASALAPSADAVTSLAAPSTLASRGAAELGDRGLCIAGTVADSRGKPLSAVRLNFSTEDGTTIAQLESDAAGRFERYVDSSLRSENALEVLARSADFCEVRTSARLGKELTIVMQRLPRVEVHVVTPDGSSPTGSGCVQLAILDPSSQKTRSTSLELDEDGIARSDPLQPGQLVRVRGQFEGFAMSDMLRGDELAGDAVVRIDVALVRGVTLRGVVLDETTRRPVDGALVRAEASDPRNWFAAPSATTDSSGRFELRAVTATQRAYFGQSTKSDLYRVTVEASDFVFLASRSQVLKHAASAPPPSLVENLELLLVPAGCELTGSLRWRDGHEIGDFFIVRVADSCGNTVSVRASPDGSFRFKSLCSGELRIAAFGAEALASTKVILERGEKKSVALTLTATDVSLAVRIVDNRGRGVPGLALQCGGTLGETLMPYRRWGAASDAQGNVRIEKLLPGVADVSMAFWEEQGYDQESTMAIWPPRRTLELEAGKLATAEFLAEPAVLCAGTLDPNAPIDPFPWVSVELTHPEFGTITSVTVVNPDRSFTITGVFDADYVLVAKQDKRELGRIAFPRGGSRDLIIPFTAR